MDLNLKTNKSSHKCNLVECKTNQKHKSVSLKFNKIHFLGGLNAIRNQRFCFLKIGVKPRIYSQNGIKPFFIKTKENQDLKNLENKDLELGYFPVC